MISDLVEIIKRGDCADCWMTTPARAASALDEYFTVNRKAAIIKDGGEGARLLCMWAQKKECDIRVFEMPESADDMFESYKHICRCAGKEGYDLVLDGETADAADIALLVRSGVKAPLFLSRIRSAEIPAVMRMLETEQEDMG